MDDGVFMCMNFTDDCATTLPKVSVALPNLNNRRFLTERLDSIVNQTLIDWELIIVDSYSDDGAWELIQEYAAHDRRFRISQAPRDGIYPNLNRCIAQAGGNYVYIATSDDTMSPNCLEKMVNALDLHSECSICHTCLTAIDEHGSEIADFAELLRPAQFYGELMKKSHIRYAPYDGILHCALYTVYTSLTQLLIRRSVFEQIGLFRDDWGSESDFEWGMRASLVYNVVHIPETLATWRIHSQQATQNESQDSSAKRQRLCQMIQAAVSIIHHEQPEYYRKKMRLRRLLFPYRRQQFLFGMKERYTKVRKIGFLLRFLFISPYAVKDFINLRFLGYLPYTNDLTYIRQELHRLRLEQSIIVLDE